MNTLKFVIVGHVDHGKSTLIGRLLYDTGSLPAGKIEEVRAASNALGSQTEFAYLLDSLEEERRGGITIDTTQVFFKTKKRQYIIIDAPGHVEFMKNMITGASQAESAVLIIDVHAGVEEQTRRHAYVLSLLGLDEIIVVINKMDLVNFDKKNFDKVKAQIEDFLSSLNIKPVSCIPISAINGDNVAWKSPNLNWYDGPSLLSAFDCLQDKETAENKTLIFPVQDIYEIQDKRIAVGRLEAGLIQQGDKIQIFPGGYEDSIATIEKYLHSDVDKSFPGESIGITTAGLTSLSRGDVICQANSQPHLADRFKATLIWLAEEDLKKGEVFTLRCATQETSCRIEVIERRINSSSLKVIQKNAASLKYLDVAEVIIKCNRPLVIKAFSDIAELGRFVFVQDDNVCAGGIIMSEN
ncbi:MAG: GTP-binding protein [Nitrospirota bacterium]